MPLLNRLSYVGLTKEVTQGTALAATVFIPATSIKPEDSIEDIKDMSFVNNPTAVRAFYQGVKDSTFDFDGMAFNEIIGNFFVALGLADTVTGTVSPYTHTFKLSNSQPPTYTLTHYDVYQSRYFPGQMLDQLDFKIDSKGAITYSTKWKGWPSSSTTDPTPTFSTTTPFLPWMVTATINGSSNARVLSADISLKRNVEPIHPLNGTQSPSTMFAGQFEATAKLNLIFNDTTDINLFYNNTQPIVLLTATQPSSGPVLTFKFNKAAFSKAVLDDGKSYIQLSCDLEGVYNATDSGPFSAVLANTVSAAY